MKQAYGKGGSMQVVTKRFNIADFIIYFALAVLAAMMLYPVWYTFIISFSDSVFVDANKVVITPIGFNLRSYGLVFEDGRVMGAYFNTIKYTVFAVVFSLFFTSLTAYPLTIRTFCLKKFVTIILAVTMFFGGGLIPYYMTIRNLHMFDTLWVMVIPGAVSAWNVIIYRTFFSGIPESLRESAYIDGANDVLILFKVILPMSKALLATMALFTIVGVWNDFFTPLIFINSPDKIPMALLLRSILITYDLNFLYESINSKIKISSSALKAASIIITVLPVMCVYPFLQKYFAKGFMIGSIKG